MKAASASAAGIRWTAATVSLAGHALAAAAVIGLDTALPPQDSPPITVELAFPGEPGSSPEIPAGPPPPDIARDPPPVETTAPAASGAKPLRIGAREAPPRTASAARTPKPRRSAPLPRTKPPAPRAVPATPSGPSTPPVQPESRVAATVEDAGPPAGPDTGRPGPAKPILDGAAAVGAADVRRPAGTRTGITRGARVAAENRPPEYPFAARRLGLEGRVLLRVEVDRAGAVERVTVTRSSGHGLLDEAARRAVGEWRFLPATVVGEAVSGAVDVPVSFRLR